MDSELGVLAMGLGGAACSIAIVVRLLRGRTALSASLLGVIAVIGFYALGNLFNRVVLPAIFGEPLQAMLEHRQPALSMETMVLLSWVFALGTTALVAFAVRQSLRPRS